MDFSRLNAKFRQLSNCLGFIALPPGFKMKHISLLQVPIVISDVASSSSSPSGSANIVSLQNNHIVFRLILHEMEGSSLDLLIEDHCRRTDGTFGGQFQWYSLCLMYCVIAGL